MVLKACALEYLEKIIASIRKNYEKLIYFFLIFIDLNIKKNPAKIKLNEKND